MKKVITLCIFFCSIYMFSQESDFWRKVRFGGGFGFGFGSNSTTIAISPSAVYDFTENFSLGLGVSYLYNKRNDFTSNVFGPNVLVLYKPIREIEFSADLQQLYVNRKQGSFSETFNYPALYIGAAYKTGKVSLGIQYDVLYKKEKSIYSTAISPIVRIYF